MPVGLNQEDSLAVSALPSVALELCSTCYHSYVVVVLVDPRIRGSANHVSITLPRGQDEHYLQTVI